VSLAARRYRLQVYIATLFLGLIGLFSAAILTTEYFKAREILLGAAETRSGCRCSSRSYATAPW
jgi:hypothetical protein